MISIVKTDIFSSFCDSIVNPINCVGIMGAGLAFEFKKRFPSMYINYARACRNKEIEVGKIWVYSLPDNRHIFNFPTKNSWKESSRLEYITKGLYDLKEKYFQYELNSISLPALGCGLGGLDFSLVYNEIVKVLDDETMNIYIHYHYRF